MFARLFSLKFAHYDFLNQNKQHERTMKILSLTFSLLLLITSQLFAQVTSVYDTPRMMVYGEASIQVEADAIIAYLNIYDNALNYDYTQPFDPKTTQSKQIALIERLDCKEYMTAPRYTDLKTYIGTGPFELRFPDRAKFEELRGKAALNNSEEMTVSIEYASSDISSEKRKQLKSQMLDLALQDAKAKGDRMAKSLGVILGLPLYVEEVMDYSTYGSDSEMYGYSPTMMVTVSSKVQIQYELKR